MNLGRIMQGRHKSFFLLLMGMLLAASVGQAQQIRVSSVNYESSVKNNKLTLLVTDSPKHRVFVMNSPSRLVVDVKNSIAARKLAQPASGHPLFGQMRTAVNNTNDLRIVIDLKENITGKTHQLSSNQIDPQHLVINLASKKNKPVTPKVNKIDEKSDEIETGVIKTSGGKIKNVPKKRFIVAIDAGHGGDDPGAHGPQGTHEKKITLAIAKKLEEFIDAEPGMRAKLVRKGDYYVGLRERMKIARKFNADLFVSIHADAVADSSVRGASVYTLSRNGASNEAARWLANSENAKERVGGVNLDDKEEMLATVLLDLSQTATQQASVNLAEKVLKNFRNVGDLHYNDVQKAGFVVLKSPDIPSILVETAYISNPADELNLLSPRYQNKMANAIFKGILNYYRQMQPASPNRMAKL